MRLSKGLLWAGIGVCLVATIPSVADAQRGRLDPPLMVVQPPMEFATSTEHYGYLLETANGGTQHTAASIPQWPGIWQAGGNLNNQIFRDGGEIREGVLTPAYEQNFRERTGGGQLYDRLAHCEPPGYPRFLLEPYSREFINLPHQSWQLNDVANENRRIYIDQEHKNVYGTHSWMGDVIGFWDGDRLITHTIELMPVDYFRAQPLTSNQFESVEVWEMKENADGTPRLEVQVTFYDEHSLVKPINTVYSYRRGFALEEAGHRIRNWECATTSNARLDPDGTTGFFLPGEEGYKDARGFSQYPDLPGQSFDPIYETTLPEN